jgi:phospholipase C
LTTTPRSSRPRAFSDCCRKNKVDWAIYGYTSSPLTRLNFTDTTNAPASHFGLFTDFQAAAAKGTLPPTSFLEPSWGASGNSQHPNYSVALGEQFIHDVYYGARNGPGWNQTLLIITYDEHGGCFDHVAPPTDAVPPDASAGEFGFDFKRFGPTRPRPSWCRPGLPREPYCARRPDLRRLTTRQF